MTGRNKILSLLLAGLVSACSAPPPDLDTLWSENTSRVRTDQVTSQGVDGATVVHERPYLRDRQGRYVHIRGVNASGTHKAPSTESHPYSLYPLPEDTDILDGCLEIFEQQGAWPPECIPSRDISYMDRPFREEEADIWFGKLAELGFNSVRLITNWESIQPYKPGTCVNDPEDESPRFDLEGCYDLRYLSYYGRLVDRAAEHGIYVLVDMHQDVFSRHLMSRYNQKPTYRDANGDIVAPDEGSLDELILSLFPPYDDWVRGHGAPRWVAQTCLPEKKMDSPFWGVSRIVGALGYVGDDFPIPNLPALDKLDKLLNVLDPDGTTPFWIAEVIEERVPHRQVGPEETSDFLPATPWLFNGALSLDVDRCFAALFAGDKVFPELVVDSDGRTRALDAIDDDEACAAMSEDASAVVAASADASAPAPLGSSSTTRVDLELPEQAIEGTLVSHVGYVRFTASQTGKYAFHLGPGILGFAPWEAPPEDAEDAVAEDAPVIPNVLECDQVFGRVVLKLEDGEEVALAVEADRPQVSVVAVRIGTHTPENLPNLKEYLQDAYEAAWVQLASVTRDKPNVIGYDVMNEPVGAFLMLTLGAVLVQSGLPDDLQTTLVDLLGEEIGEPLYDVVVELNLLPTATDRATLERYGLDHVDALTALDMNVSFDANYLQPFYERMGKAIQETDPDAIIWYEPSSSIRTITGASPFWDLPLTRPQGLNQVVFAPHWYPDIYPRPGINSPPREFNADEWMYRDFTGPLEKYLHEGPTWMGNVPVIFGEFGTYFNFGGIETSQANGYLISSHVLDSYYRAFEELNTGSMLWCFSAHNDDDYGELWNKEDFSIIGPGVVDTADGFTPDTVDPEVAPDERPVRSGTAFVRPYARATSGKQVHQRFISQHEYWDPEQGVHRPDRTYTLDMETRESDAPTVLFVPDLQYPDGFYVWLSDGSAYMDADRQLLYWYPSRDEPGWIHHLQIEPLLADKEALGWSYFFQGGQGVRAQGDSTLTGGGLAQ